MFHRISTKLVVAVLAAVVLPFVAFEVFIDVQMKDRLKRNVVQQALLGLTKDLGGRIDQFLLERRRDVELWAGAPGVSTALSDYARERRLAEAPLEGRTPEAPAWDAATLYRYASEGLSYEEVRRASSRMSQSRDFDRYVRLKDVYDLLVLVAADGHLVTANGHEADGTVIPLDHLQALFSRNYAAEEWFEPALEGRLYLVDQHRSPLAPPRNGGDDDVASSYHVGVAAPVRGPNGAQGVQGVLYALVNWRHVEALISQPVLKEYFQGLVHPGEEPSPYAWIWKSDADTILGHPDRTLYHKSVSADVGLPELRDAVLNRKGEWGLYPEYTFQGKKKNAAFQMCRSPADGGLGWVVGVGINNDDIYAIPQEMRRLLLWGTTVVLLMSVLWTTVIARRTTRPILELQRTTRRVAQGDLDARTEIGTRDELGALAQDFNVMTRELKAQRARIVRAEKDAAWREMARQIAHDIKNPLTPIKLSIDLLERARREGSPGSEEILERTLDLVRRQVENLRRIAGDFYEFTGGRRPEPGPVRLDELVDEVLHLHDAWAVELGVDVRREGRSGVVLADRGKLQRVLVNVVSNALQAMPDGGHLRVETRREGDWLEVRIRDTGIGLSGDVERHLFEPYFTTKSEGTGLGLAISHRVVEELGGTISLRRAEEDPELGSAGTTAVVRLPAHDPSAAPTVAGRTRDGGGADGRPR